MKSHLAKAKHNETFLEFIEKNTVEDFHDWRITIIFYAAIHYLKAFLKLKRVPGGYTHKQIEQIINPDKAKAKFPLPQEIYNLYNDLLENSRNARYMGHYSNDFQLLMQRVKIDESKKCLSGLKKYFKKEGLNI